MIYAHTNDHVTCKVTFVFYVLFFIKELNYYEKIESKEKV